MRVTLAQDSLGSPAGIFSDIQAAINAVTRRPADSSQWEARQMLSALGCSRRTTRINFEWCPGHVGIRGSEVARAAGAAARRPVGGPHVSTDDDGVDEDHEAMN